MRGLSGDDLLKLPVRLGGLELARAINVVVDLGARRALGLELHCGDGIHRFLPLGVATFDREQIAVDSALAVVDDIGYYLKHGRRLHDLRGAPVTRDGRAEGRLADVVLNENGVIVEVVVEGGRRIAFAPAVTVGPVPMAA